MNRRMKREIALLLPVLFLMACSTAIVKGATHKQPITAERIFKNAYLGEAYHSGLIYIEPFGKDRETVNQPVKFTGYPKRLKFYPCQMNPKVKNYDAIFNKLYQSYVPGLEPESIYFSQPFSEPEQFGLCYQTKVLPKSPELGITFFNIAVSKVKYDVAGKKRPYTALEYKKALNVVKKDQEVQIENRTLDTLNLDFTIVGATQLLIVNFCDTPLTLRLSKYFTHGFEYAADVYVIDILSNGKVIKTYEKHNWDGPY